MSGHPPPSTGLLMDHRQWSSWIEARLKEADCWKILKANGYIEMVCGLPAAVGATHEQQQWQPAASTQEKEAAPGGGVQVAEGGGQAQQAGEEDGGAAGNATGQQDEGNVQADAVGSAQEPELELAQVATCLLNPNLHVPYAHVEPRPSQRLQQVAGSPNTRKRERDRSSMARTRTAPGVVTRQNRKKRVRRRMKGGASLADAQLADAQKHNYASELPDYWQ